jgi:hypothetical protein
MGLDDWLWLRAAVTHAFRAGASELSISPLSIAASAIGMAIVRSGDVRGLALTCSVLGIASCRVSLVKIMNSDRRRGSAACSVSSIRFRARCSEAGRLIVRSGISPFCQMGL